MKSRAYATLRVAAVAALVWYAPQALADAVDLNTWTEESLGTANWNVAADGSSVTQTQNGDPTVFYSDFDAIGSDVQGKIRVNTGSDDDFVGFVLGYNTNDLTNPTADFLLVDWKQGTQSFNFSDTALPGGVAPEGLAVSRVTGTPALDEYWQHTDYAADTGGGLEELARGNTLDSTGWEDNTEYTFRFIFQPNRLQVFVDGALELDVTGSFSDGSLGFYNFSQRNVTYSAFTREDAPMVPEPSSLALLALGAAGLAARRRLRRRS